MIPTESLNLLVPTLVWWCIIKSQIVFQKDWFAVFKVKVTVKAHIIKIWLSNISSELLILLQLTMFYGTSLQGGLSCEKIGLFCCDQGQGHRKDSEFQWKFIWMISPVLLNLLWLNFVWWCNIMGLNIMQEDWFAVFKFRVTMRAHLIRYDCFYHICWSFGNQI